MNSSDASDLAPVVEAAAPSMADAGMNNDAMKSALKGIGLTLPKTMQQRCDPKKRIGRLRQGGGKDMTEAAIMKGLTWLKNNQDPDGGWGEKDKTDRGKPPTIRKGFQGCDDGNGSSKLFGSLRIAGFADFRPHGPKGD